MTIPDKNQLKLLLVFYKSTLAISLTSSILFIIFYYSDIAATLTAFGFSFLSAGTLFSLLYKEISQQHQYYFYYNKGLSKKALITSCTLTNLVIGLSLIIVANYAKHP